MGSWPSAQAGNAIEAQIDLRERGGCVISSRRFTPAWQRVSSWAMASMCQLGLKASLGDTVANTLRTNRDRSKRRVASSSL